MKKDFIFQCLCFLIYFIIDRCDGAGLLNELSGIACEVRKGLEDETTYKGRRLLFKTTRIINMDFDGNLILPQSSLGKSRIKVAKTRAPKKSIKPKKERKEKNETTTSTTKKRTTTKRRSTSKNETIKQQNVSSDAHFYPTGIDHITTTGTSRDYIQETSTTCNSCTTKKESETTTHLGIWSKIKKIIFSKFGLDTKSNQKNREISTLKLNQASKIPMVSNGVSSEKKTSNRKLKMKAKLAEGENAVYIKCTTKAPLPKLDSNYAPSSDENNSNMNSGNPKLCSGEVEEEIHEYVPPKPRKPPIHYIDDE